MPRTVPKPTTRADNIIKPHEAASCKVACWGGRTYHLPPQTPFPWLAKNNKRNQFEPHQPETVEVFVSGGRKIETPRKEQNVQLSVLNKRGSHLGSWSAAPRYADVWGFSWYQSSCIAWKVKSFWIAHAWGLYRWWKIENQIIFRFAGIGWNWIHIDTRW